MPVFVCMVVRLRYQRFQARSYSHLLVLLAGLARALARDRRLQAAELFAHGQHPAQVARTLGVPRQSATRWRTAWTAGGTEALTSKGPSGPPPRLTEQDLERVRQALLEGAAAHGFTGELWTLAQIAARDRAAHRGCLSPRLGLGDPAPAPFMVMARAAAIPAGGSARAICPGPDVPGPGQPCVSMTLVEQGLTEALGGCVTKCRAVEDQRARLSVVYALRLWCVAINTVLVAGRWSNYS